MIITKHTHACVRIEGPGGTLVIDPGVWTEPQAVEGADAVLVTHEHSDHMDVHRLSGMDIPVYVPDGARVGGMEVIRVHPGEEFTAGGMTIEAVGGRHAFTYSESPGCVNIGYIVDGSCYHPGDSLYVPERQVDILFTPVHGSWMRTSEAIDFVKEIRPRHAVAIHEAQLNHRGLASVNDWFAKELGDRYRYLKPAESFRP